MIAKATCYVTKGRHAVGEWPSRAARRAAQFVDRPVARGYGCGGLGTANARQPVPVARQRRALPRRCGASAATRAKVCLIVGLTRA